MPDIFLSYAKEDREAAQRVASLLEAAGWNVWWDRRIPAGRTWRSMIEQALRDMRCMVVLWSSSSIQSDWVKEEAEEARILRKLVPVLIEAVEPPVGFRSIQAADLADWDGSNDAPGARQLITDLESLFGQAQPAAEPTATDEKKRKVRSRDAERARAPADDGGAYRGLPAGAGRTGKFIFNWKVAAGGAAAIAVLVLALLWVKQDETEVPQPQVAKEAAPAPAPPQRLLGIAVNSERTEIMPEETLNLSLKGQYAGGAQEEIRDGIEWASSDSRVATVDSNGRVKARQAGRTEITAQYQGLVSQAWTLTVQRPQAAAPPEAPKLVALTLNADKRELRIDEKTSLYAKAKYSDGSEKRLLSGVTWQSSDTNVASISPKGELEARRAGTVEIVARSNGIRSAPLNLLVKEVPPVNPSPQPPLKKPDEPAKIPAVRAPADSLKIAGYLERAREYRVQGGYAAALAELEKGRSLEPSNQEIRQEIELTKRACNAEKKLGRAGLEC